MAALGEHGTGRVKEGSRRGPAPVIPDQVLAGLVGEGLRHRAIARIYGLAEGTVRERCGKLGIRSPHGPGRPKRYDKVAIRALFVAGLAPAAIAARLGYPRQQVATIISREGWRT